MKKSALFIGLNEYEEDSNITPLRFGINDALRGAKVFKEKCGFDTTVLVGADVTQKKIYRELERQSKRLGPDDTFVLAMCTHGLSHHFDNGTRHLFAMYDSLAGRLQTFLDQEMLLSELKHIRARHQVVLLDSCKTAYEANRSLGGSRPNSLDSDLTRDIGLRLTAVDKSAKPRKVSVCVVSACRQGEAAYEDPDLSDESGEFIGHGVFMGTLLNAIEDEASWDEDNEGRRILEIRALAARVEHAIAEKPHHNRQTPTFTQEGAEAIILARRPAPRRVETAPPVAAPMPDTPVAGTVDGTMVQYLEGALDNEYRNSTQQNGEQDSQPPIDDFDLRVVRYLAKEFEKEHGIDLTKDWMATRRLSGAVEKAKIELYSSLSTRVDLPFIISNATGPKHLSLELTRAQLQALAGMASFAMPAAAPVTTSPVVAPAPFAPAPRPLPAQPPKFDAVAFKKTHGELAAAPAMPGPVSTEGLPTTKGTVSTVPQKTSLWHRAAYIGGALLVASVVAKNVNDPADKSRNTKSSSATVTQTAPPARQTAPAANTTASANTQNVSPAGIAAYELGRKYYLGTDGVARNFAKALEQFQIAIRHGHADAEASLGRMYFYGHGVSRDGSRATELFQSSADKGSLRGMSNLGLSYMNGCDVPKDVPKGIDLIKRAANAGGGSAQAILAWAYLNGQEVQKIVGEATRLARLSAAQEDPQGQQFLGWLYESGQGVQKDLAEARRLYELSAAQGNGAAQVSLAYMHMYGEAGLKKDLAAAARLFHLAVQDGNTAAQYMLGTLYAGSEWGQPDHKEARRLYELAAGQGFAPAQVALGRYHYNGTAVERVDHAKAASLYKLAADQGNADGQFELANLHRDGIVVRFDPAEARRLWKLAADQGHAAAKTALDAAK